MRATTRPSSRRQPASTDSHMETTMNRSFLAAVSLGLLAAALALPGCGGSDDPVADPTVVQTQQGTVKGTAANGVQTFLGVPYAAPPTGPLRWKPPAAALNRTDVLNASQ